MSNKSDKKKAKVIEIKNLPDIVITAGKLELLGTPQFQNLLNKQYPNVRLKYWLARISDKMKQELRVYAEAKQEIIDKYKETDPAKLKGVPEGQWRIKEDEFKEYIKELDKLQEPELPLGIKKIGVKFNDLEQCTPNEIEMLLPFVEISDE